MDNEFQDEYGARDRRNRKYKIIAAVSVAIVLLAVTIGVVVATTRKTPSSSSTSSNLPSRTFAFNLGSLEGDASQTGTIYIKTRPDWAPLGVDRFHDLVESDFFINTHFFRVVPGFVVQFGISGDTAIENQWRLKDLKDDPVVAKNVKGTVSFANSGPDTRTTQIFINLSDNSKNLDNLGFAPIGEVILGMDIVERINSEWGQQAKQQKIISQGNSYLDTNFPRMSYVISAIQSFKPV
eukprot:CAMPEP_0119011386 /NCGR_PEP_ID=MMETSP1176-20130426/5645_1 /TAXON_ID=265551 /ORGANISM="Synedropsis recta cf, Strain CCMP1620" /LENGTH=237 /DNA_ID=CAMNT_0006964211 /DNA_START=52 /DNA_END=765 /DNA_ORIENTATION=-